MSQNILFVGGGSIGHIAPAVAVWEQLCTVRPNVKAHFVCSTRPNDGAFLERSSLTYTAFDAPRMSFMFPIQFFRAIREANRLLDMRKSNVVFSKGGYVSLPICYAAHKRGIPIITHESDVVSGYANRIIARWAQHICTGFPKSTASYGLWAQSSKLIAHSFTGNPIRTEMTAGSRKEALKITGFDGKKPVLLVSGGSQGASAINSAIASMLDDLLLRCDIIHITGRGKLPTTDNRQPTTSHYYSTEFAGPELAHLYAAADLAVSRAGAGAIAEHAANGIPTILIPLRGAGHDHQYTNAVAAAASGGCIHLEQDDLNTTLLNTVHALIADSEKRREMGKRIRTLFRPDAALQIATIIAQTLDSRTRGE